MVNAVLLYADREYAVNFQIGINSSTLFSLQFNYKL